MGNSDAHLAGLERRLDLLDAERAITRTLYRYAHAFDYGLQSEWADCFTENALFEMQWPDDPGELQRAMPAAEAFELGIRCKGRESLKSLLAILPHFPKSRQKHGLMEPVIEVDLDLGEASVESYFFTPILIGDSIVITSFGRYFDMFARCADGRWRLASRIIKIEAQHKAASLTQVMATL